MQAISFCFVLYKEILDAIIIIIYDDKIILKTTRN
jgi:hypothetical protein